MAHGSFPGQACRESEPRETRYNARKCEPHRVRMRPTNAKFGVCGMCLQVCPHGHKIR